MADLTADQITDMQGDLAIGSDEAVFTDEELQRFYTRAGDDYNTAVYFAFRQILAQKATVWVDYQVAQTKVSRSQAFANLKALVETWKDIANTSANQLLVVGMNSVPVNLKPKPADEYPRPRSLRHPWRWGW